MTPGTIMAGRFATGGADNRVYKRDKDGRFSSGGGGAAGEFDAAVASAKTGPDALGEAELKSEPTQPQLAAIGRMGGDGAYVVNADLRTRATVDDLAPKNRATVDQLDSVMASAHLASDVVVHRHIANGMDVFGRDVDSSVGDITGASWRDRAYVSTSMQDRGATGHRIRMRILVPAGTGAFSHPSLDSDEILLDRGLTFTVVRDHGPAVVRHLDVVVSR